MSNIPDTVKNIVPEFPHSNQIPGVALQISLEKK